MSIPKDEQNAIDFITSLRTQWPKRFEHEQAEMAWLDMMVDELKGYHEDVLKEAARYLLRKKLRGFPLLGECHDACVEAKRFLEWKKPELRPSADAPKSGAAKFQSLADEIAMGPVGRKAAREGWHVQLHDFVRKRGRQPDEYGIRDLVRQAREFEETYDAILRGMPVADADGEIRPVPSFLVRLFQDLGGKMMARREELRERVLGKDAS